MLDRKLLREIYRAKGLLLAITSIIAVGVMCFVAMQSAYHNLRRAKSEYYRQCRMADFWIDVKKVPETELMRLAQLPGVVEIRPRIQFLATADLPDTVEPVNGLVLSMPDRPRAVLNDIVMRRGDYFTDRRLNEVILNDSFARAHGLGPGDWIHLLLNNRRQALFVVGTAISSEFTYLLGPGSIVPDPARFGVFYVKRRFAEEVFDFEGAANQVVGRLEPAMRQQPQAVLRQAETLLESYGVLTTTALRRQASNQFLSAEIEGLGAFATVVPSIFLVVAAMVLNVLLTRLVRQQRVVIGTLKALGYTDWQVFGHFVKFGLSVGVAGGLLGSVCGYLVSIWMTSMYRIFFQFPQLLSGVYPTTHAIGISASLVCALAGSVHGAAQVLRLDPAEAMRPAAPRRGGPILLERIGPLWQLLSTGWRLAVRSVVRHRVRTGVTLLATALGASLLVTGFMMISGQNFFIDFQFYRVMRSDLELALKDERSRQALDELRQLPAVDRAEASLHVPCTFVHGPYRRKGGITGIATGAQLTVPRDTAGQRLRLPRAGLLMSRTLAGILHVEPGQSVTVIPVKGRRRPVQMTVAQVADSYMGMSVYAEIGQLNRLVDQEAAVSSVQLQVDGNPEHLRQLYRRLKQMPGIQTINSRQAMIDNINKAIIENQWIFIGLLTLFAGVIFFGSIVNASMVNLAERQRETATFRALGYGPWRIGGMFFRENVLIVLAGFLAGLPLGYGLMVLTALSYKNDLIRFPVVWAPWVGYTAFFMAVVFALLAQAVVQLTIHKMDYLEALQVKE